jgi:hypothetical protein
MCPLATNSKYALGLRVGDVVQIRSEEEILSTLDENGKLDGLPFMPEMLQYCGKSFNVFKRVDKACDTIVRDGLRRMKNTVLLDDLRCDGGAHEGCEAACTILWKEAWLTRVAKGHASESKLHKIKSSRMPGFSNLCSVEALLKATRTHPSPGSSDEERFFCQATEMRTATSRLAWWDPGQYWRDIRSGNVGPWPLIRAFSIWLFNVAQRYRRGAQFPFIEGKLTKTPHLALGLHPGELVRLKPKAEILKTLDTRNRNRGLSFDRELVKYCGGTYRVRQRVEKVISETTGKLIRLTNPSIILEGVTCTGDFSRHCPRNIFHFVREIWLERVPGTVCSSAANGACNGSSAPNRTAPIACDRMSVLK